jgi:hypothetical protein
MKARGALRDVQASDLDDRLYSSCQPPWLQKPHPYKAFEGGTAGVNDPWLRIKSPHDGGASRSLSPETLLLIRVLLVETEPSSSATDRFRTNSSLAIVQTAHQALNNLPPIRNHRFPLELSWQVCQTTQSSPTNLRCVIWGRGACEQTRDQRRSVFEKCRCVLRDDSLQRG